MAGRAPVIPNKKKMKPEPSPSALPLEERIRQRAHEIYLQRGGQDGSEIEDWLQAEQEILGQDRSEGLS